MKYALLNAFEIDSVGRNAEIKDLRSSGLIRIEDEGMMGDGHVMDFLADMNDDFDFEIDEDEISTMAVQLLRDSHLSIRMGKKTIYVKYWIFGDTDD